MISVNDRVVRQVQSEQWDCSQERARHLISQMTALELLEYVSVATDEMFKEFDDAVSIRLQSLSDQMQRVNNRNGG